MASQSTMLHVRVDDRLKNEAAEALAGVGLTLSDAVRILLTRIAAEGGLPAGLTADPDAYDAWFRAKVHEALNDPQAAVSHDEVMRDAHASDRRQAACPLLNGSRRRPPICCRSSATSRTTIRLRHRRCWPRSVPRSVF